MLWPTRMTKRFITTRVEGLWPVALFFQFSFKTFARPTSLVDNIFGCPRLGVYHLLLAKTFDTFRNKSTGFHQKYISITSHFNNIIFKLNVYYWKLIKKKNFNWFKLLPLKTSAFGFYTILSTSHDVFSSPFRLQFFHTRVAILLRRRFVCNIFCEVRTPQLTIFSWTTLYHYCFSELCRWRLHK